MTTQERIAVLETKVDSLSRTNEDIIQKLDALLHLRSKGIGAFWLTASLMGTGIIGVLATIIDWVRGVH